MQNHDIEKVYPFQKRFDKLTQDIKQSSMPKVNKEAIAKFTNNCFAEGLSIGRINRYIHNLKQIANWLGNKKFEDVTTEDIKSLIAELEKKDYSEWTKYGFKVTLKKFFQQLRGFEWHSKQYPKEVEWIRLNMKNNNKIVPSDLLTEQDIKKLIDSADNPRDKSLVAVLYDSGCRIGEILTLKLKHVSFDKYGAILHVNGKTGKRRVRIIASVPYLME